MYNGTAYAYVKSLQGDIVAILDENGNTVVSYGYDAWGAPLWCTGELAETLGKVQPFRYRGYVFDEETGLYYLRSRYYNAERCRFLNADGYISTGQGILESNMFAYCGNNPIIRADYIGQLWNEVLGFFRTAAAEIEKAVASIAPVYAGCGGLVVADGPLPFGDILAAAGAAALTVGAIGYGIYQAAQETTVSIPKSEEKTKTIATTPPLPTIIYRYGGTNPGNLTPRAKDKYSGLSFSTVPMPGAAMTTIEAVNATGVVYAVKDGATHVSIRPVGAKVDDWINAGSDSIWTKAVKSVVIKWNGW